MGPQMKLRPPSACCGRKHHEKSFRASLRCKEWPKTRKNGAPGSNKTWVRQRSMAQAGAPGCRQERLQPVSLWPVHVLEGMARLKTASTPICAMGAKRMLSHPESTGIRNRETSNFHAHPKTRTSFSPPTPTNPCGVFRLGRRALREKKSAFRAARVSLSRRELKKPLGARPPVLTWQIAVQTVGGVCESDPVEPGSSVDEATTRAVDPWVSVFA